MGLWIIKGSDFVNALKQAFEKHDEANQDYLMAEFNIADHGVTKRQRWQFIDDSPSEEIIPKPVSKLDSHALPKLYGRNLMLIRTRKRKNAPTDHLTAR